MLTESGEHSSQWAVATHLDCDQRAQTRSPGRGSARKPEIMADAAFHILTQASKSTTGQSFLDEQVLRGAGIRNFEGYAMTPGSEPILNFFVDM